MRLKTYTNITDDSGMLHTSCIMDEYGRIMQEKETLVKETLLKNKIKKYYEIELHPTGKCGSANH